MCQERQFGQAIQNNPNFRNPRFFGNPNVQGEIVNQARGRFFDPTALNAAGNMAPPSPPVTPQPNAPVPTPSGGANTATGLPSLASLMQRANVPSGVAAQAMNIPMRGGG